jgi:hypothetical protein
MKKIFFFLACFLTVYGINGFSQSQPLQTKKKNTRFHSYNSLVLLTGDQTVSGAFQTVNGIEWKSFFAGAGLGMDFYGISTTPIFLDLRKSFGKGKRQFFLYGDIGYQFAWPGSGITVDGSKDGLGNNGGLYTDIGLGYQIGMGKNDALFFSAGYSYKTLTETIIVTPLCIVGTLCEASVFENTYKFNRLSFKIGWRF